MTIKIHFIASLYLILLAITNVRTELPKPSVSLSSKDSSDNKHPLEKIILLLGGFVIICVITLKNDVYFSSSAAGSSNNNFAMKDFEAAGGYSSTRYRLQPLFHLLRLFVMKNPVFHSRMKHLDRERVLDGTLGVHQVADLLTKPLGRDFFMCFRSKIRVSDGSSILRGCVKD
nr:Retrovirus-related Pol polyprotein from transposon RE2 [Ipomoea batatas]